jgi:hypothetical protein
MARCSTFPPFCYFEIFFGHAQEMHVLYAVFLRQACSMYNSHERKDSGPWN